MTGALVHINELPHYGDTNTTHGIIEESGGDILQVDAKYADGTNVSVQTTADELKLRIGKGSVKSVTGVSSGMVGNNDPENPQILHDPYMLPKTDKAADTAKVDGVVPSNVGKELLGAVNGPAARAVIGAMDANKTADDLGGIPRVSGATAGNIPVLDANGRLVDSGMDADEVGKVDGAVLNGTTINPDQNKLLQLG